MKQMNKSDIILRKVTVPVKGMHCRSCELLVEQALKDISGVEKAEADFRAGKAALYFNRDVPDQGEAIYKAVKNAGYDVGYASAMEFVSKNESDYNHLLNGLIILLAIYFIAKLSGLLDYSFNTENAGMFVAFLVGLTAGISTCMALVGGLVLGISARHAEVHPEATATQKFRPHIFFNLGRLLGFGFFGGILSSIGSVLQPSSGILGFMTIVVGGVMIFLGLKLIRIFPFVERMNISIPKAVVKALGADRKRREYSHKGAFITGALTFFLPCGFTQAMQLYAAGSGSFLNGAIIMFLFALGTAPGLLGIGGLSSVFKGERSKTFFATTGLAVIILGWFNISNGGQLISQERIGGEQSGTSLEEFQEVRMTQSGSGYSPKVFTVERGRRVKWIITSTNPFSCASTIVMPKYGISKGLNKGENVIEFIPAEVGEIPFSCSMGMYRGKFIVVEPGQKTISEAEAEASEVQDFASGGGGCGGGNKRKIDSQTVDSQVIGNEQVIKADFTVSSDIAPNNFKVKKGIPVKFKINAKESGRGCMSTIMIPNLYDTAKLLQKGDVVLEFTPQNEGSYNITCGMGVPRGVINVVE